MCTELPNGRGTFLPSIVANAVAAGWGVNDVTTFQAGYPLGFTNATNNIAVCVWQHPAKFHSLAAQGDSREYLQRIRSAPESSSSYRTPAMKASSPPAGLTGQPPSIPSLVDVVSRISADRVKSTIQNGASPMPAFTSLSEKEVDALVAYLSTPSKAHVPPDILAYLSAPRPPPPPAPGTPATRYWTGYGYMNSSEGLPANKPPWSTLTAYDLNEGTIKWQIPTGQVTGARRQGIKGTGSYWPRGRWWSRRAV